jgi:hypothetical protein
MITKQRGEGAHLLDALWLLTLGEIASDGRIGRVLIGRGRDAGDVPIAMVFGQHLIENFTVTEEINPVGGAR